MCNKMTTVGEITVFFYGMVGFSIDKNKLKKLMKPLIVN